MMRRRMRREEKQEADEGGTREPKTTEPFYVL